MKRIMIIGNGGSGKTTLAINLAKLLNLPLYHLDQYYWKSGWIRSDPDDFAQKHLELCKKENWIIEGVSKLTMHTRMQYADIVIFIDISRYRCLFNVILRSIRYYGQVRFSSAPGCPERFELEFYKWVWNFKKNYNPLIYNLLNEFKDKDIYILKSYSEINDFLEKIKLN